LDKLKLDLKEGLKNNVASSPYGKLTDNYSTETSQDKRNKDDISIEAIKQKQIDSPYNI